MKKVVDAAVDKAYGTRRAIAWMEIYSGERRPASTDPMPGFQKKHWKRCENSPWVSGPLTTPVGGGIRSLNVALRQELDLYVCMRPVRWFKGVPSPCIIRKKTDMVIFGKTRRISMRALNGKQTARKPLK